ncbi:MAG: ribose 5-phosphate isomerase B [Clostridia bacterium]|nr:ribose 5-phosphate isomerase B [Clostridia bacterium]
MINLHLPIAMASDHGGFQLKEELEKVLKEKGYEVIDFGTYTPESCDYPDFAVPACRAVTAGKCGCAILVCGTGIGMSICANKIPGIRAAVCENTVTTEFTRRHNDANVLCLGQRIVSSEMAIRLTEIFLNTEFEGGRHSRRIEKISAIEKR